MTTTIEEIKARLKLEDIIGESFSIVGRGRIRSTVEHDSLKIWVEQGRWWWFSRNVGGDVLDWVQHTQGGDLATAIEELARRAGVERRPLSPEEQQQRSHQAAHHAALGLAAQYHHTTLASHPDARAGRDYCAGRGWDVGTIQREMLGYTLAPGAETEGNRRPLHAALREAGLLEHPTSKAILAMPGEMLVYVHRRHGQVVYLSARSITAKRHWNLPADLAGGRQLYSNHPLATASGALCVLVEGQADAVSLGAAGVGAIALCGLDASDLPDVTHIGVDNDAAGRKRAVEIALASRPLTPIIEWPGGAKDAAEWLQKTPPNPGQLEELFSQAAPGLAVAAGIARRARGDQRQEQIRRVLDAYLSLDELSAADNRERIAAALGGSPAQFSRLLAARRKEREGDKPAAERFEYSAGMFKAGLLFEQILTNDKERSLVMFAVRQPDGQIKLQASIDTPGCTYIPYPADMAIIDKRVVLFPSGLADYGDVRKLIATIQAFLHRYLDIDPFYERLAAYYILLTWLYDLFETLPYLRALGDYGTGKSRFLQAIGCLCYRPMFVSGASTVSPIFRLIDMFKGTLIIDEADFANSDAEAEIIKILNVGYYRGGVVLRAEKDPNSHYDDYWPSAKDVYGPKLLATRRPFADRATESRCLTRRMSTARPRPDIPFILGPGFWHEATQIRNQLLRYRLENYRPIHVDHSLADQSVEPRLNQVTMALKAIVDDPAMRADIDGFIRAYNEVLINDRQMSVAAIIVQALAAIYFNGKTNILGEDMRDFSMKGIADKAQAIINEIDPETRINPKTVSRTLSEDLGLSKRTKHPATRRDLVDFAEPELHNLMLRYGIEKPERQ